MQACPPQGIIIFDEPWAFMQPVRHALGALCMEQGWWAEAERAYRDDLGHNPEIARPYTHPNNVWALHGLCEVLRRQHQSLPALEHQLKVAMSRTDGIRITSSCMCRRAAEHVPATSTVSLV